MSELTLLNPGIRPKRASKRRNVFWICFFGILAAVVGAWIIPSCNADHRARGREQFEARDYHGAIEELTWALQRNPDDFESRYYLARAQLRASRRFDAKVSFRELRKSPVYRKTASRNLITLLAAEKEFDAARKILTEEMEAAPEDPEWIEIRGLLTLKRGDAEIADQRKPLSDVVGDWPADWALTRIRRSRTFPSDKAFEAELDGTINGLQVRNDLRDAAPLRQLAAKARSGGLTAQADFMAAAARNPLAFRSQAELGAFAIERYDMPAAIKYFTAVINFDESKLPDPESRAAYAEQHMRAVDVLTDELAYRNRVEEALALLESENAKSMLDPNLKLRLGRMLLKTGQWDRLNELATAVLEDDPKNTWASFFKGHIAAHAGKNDDAVTYFSRAQIQQPGNGEINAALARALAKVGFESQAGEHFKIALASGMANDADVNIDYAQLLARQTTPLQAAEYLEDRLRLYFNDPASKDQQRILEEIRKYSATAGIGATSLADARIALVANPDNLFVKLNLAKLEHEVGLSTIALPRCQEVTGQYPGLADGWLLTAQILTDMNRGEEALPALKKAAALRGDDPNIPWLEGRINLKAGALDDARRALTRALEIDPKLAGARLDLLEVELQAKNFDAARRYAEALLESYPGDPRVQSGVGLARLAMNDPKGAIEPLRKALAANKDDAYLKVRLAKALLDTGAPADEARTLLTEVASSQTQSRGMTRTAADALSDAGFFKEAAEGYARLFATATDEAERTELSMRAFWAHTRSGNTAAALDELARLASTDRKLLAARTLVVAAEKAGFHREAGAQADLLRANDGHNEESLLAAKDAHLALKQWNKAIDDLDDLGRLNAARLPELMVDRAYALLGLGKTAEASQIAAQAATMRSGDPMKPLRLKLDVAMAEKNADDVEAALREILAESPGDSESRLLAAVALAGMGQFEKAQLVLTAGPVVLKDEPSALAAAGILLAAQDLTGAGAILEAAPKSRRITEARSVVAVLQGKDAAPDAPFATFLDRMARKDLAGAKTAVASLPDPASLREQWLAIAQVAEGNPEAAKAVAHDLLRARLYHDSVILADKSDAILRTLAENAGGAATPFDLLRAWWKLERGDAKPAADIVVPMMETRGRMPMVLLAAAVAGIKLVGESSPLKLVEGGAGAVPELFVSDLFRYLAARGWHATAAKVFPKLAKPVETDRAIRFLIAVERRELRDAEKHLATLGEATVQRPELRAGRLWVQAQGEKTKAAAATEIRALFALPKELERVDRVVLFEAAVLSGITAEAAAFLRQELADAKFSSETLNRYGTVLQNLKTQQVAFHQIEEWLRIVDPTGKLRALTPRPIVLDPQ